MAIELIPEEKLHPAKAKINYSPVLDIERLLDRAHEVLPLPAVFLIDDFASQLTDIIKSAMTVRPSRKDRPWFDHWCRLARRTQLQLREWGAAVPAAQPIIAFFRKICRRTYMVEREKYAAATEALLVEEAKRCPYMLGGHISIDEVLSALLRSLNGKSPGPDQIKNEHLKQVFALAPCWAELFNECLRTGAIPKEWSKAILSIIPKGKGDPMLAASWRGIAKKKVS